MCFEVSVRLLSKKMGVPISHSLANAGVTSIFVSPQS